MNSLYASTSQNVPKGSPRVKKEDCSLVDEPMLVICMYCLLIEQHVREAMVIKKVASVPQEETNGGSCANRENIEVLWTLSRCQIGREADQNAKWRTFKPEDNQHD